MITHRDSPAPTDAKRAILDYCLGKGALAAGVADLEAIERIAPAGHRPSDLMPRVRSVISLGVGGQTQGAWTVPAKAMAYFGSTETRAYTSPTAVRSSSRAGSAPDPSTARPTSTTNRVRGCRCRA